jgi:transcriptional regulator of met regulon
LAWYIKKKRKNNYMGNPKNYVPPYCEFGRKYKSVLFITIHLAMYDVIYSF